MAASNPPENGLAEVHRESALHLINRVKYTTDPPGDSFIEGFDAHILDSLPRIQGNLPKSTWARGDIIEIQGPAASGKTHLLYFWTMTCILPYEISIKTEQYSKPVTVLLGGRNKSVVVCDCDARWSVIRLRSIISTYLYERLAAVVSESQLSANHDVYHSAISTVISEALRRTHIFRPTSTLLLATTLMSIPAYHKSCMPNEDIGMLMVDSLSSFYWADRWTAEQSDKASQLPVDLPPVQDATVPLIPQPHPLKSDANPLRHVLTVILQLRRSLGIITFLTNWGLTLLDSQIPSSTVYFRQHLRAPYPSPFDPEPPRSKFPLVHHVTIPPQGPPPFEEGISLGGAVQDLEQVGPLKGLKLRAQVRTIAKRPGEARAIAESEFEFSITQNGIFVS